jgi:hypothetical protein
VLTFTELRDMFAERDIDSPTSARRRRRLRPAARQRLGARSSPSPRGLLQAAGLHEDLLAGDIVAAEGMESSSPP